MELIEASRVLEAAAVEAADLGTQLASCVGCPMPPVVRSSVNHLIATADSVLDSIALRLHGEAVDLARRAVLAATDSLTAAVSVDAGGSAWFGSYIPPSTMVLGGSTPAFTVHHPDGTPAYMPTMAVIGGTSSPSFTVVGPNGEPGYSPSMAVIGGHSWSTPSAGSALTGVIGPSSGDGWGLMSLARAQQTITDRAQARIDRIIANPNSSAFEIGVAMRAQGTLGDNISHILAPSRRDLENRFGYPLTDSQIRSISPFTLPSFAR